jgi:hypothetical protein
VDTYRSVLGVVAALAVYALAVFGARLLGVFSREQTVVATVGGMTVAGVVLVAVGWRFLGR